MFETSYRGSLLGHDNGFEEDQKNSAQFPKKAIHTSLRGLFRNRIRQPGPPPANPTKKNNISFMQTAAADNS